ncbi:hypothetical protein PILCRDRAFT_739132 [Piloderma croceum F 1598]|uniref:Uncharacterized protein n=1 Tax=Piloderma croceum (strain F 1598) TaxID=765440 RepID=A0A0C3EXF6_PILCF|nr:hypothetical protein PILCRDRAFT_739132 [Piloderma croceum F 1598]
MTFRSRLCTTLLHEWYCRRAGVIPNVVEDSRLSAGIVCFVYVDVIWYVVISDNCCGQTAKWRCRCARVEVDLTDQILLNIEQGA